MRLYHEQALRSGVRTAFGLRASCWGDAVPWSGAFLQQFADGAVADMSERPQEVPPPNFIRYCADDFKTLYYEGYIAIKPAAATRSRAGFGARLVAGHFAAVRDRLTHPMTRAEGCCLRNRALVTSTLAVTQTDPACCSGGL